MTYSNDVQPILEANCYSCHGNGNINGGVTLDNYAGVKAVADNGFLVGVITHAAGYPPMPDGGGKLSDCNINKIKDWINRGATNN
jgi:mono/diheme cytochrome c family protein